MRYYVETANRKFRKTDYVIFDKAENNSKWSDAYNDENIRNLLPILSPEPHPNEKNHTQILFFDSSYSSLDIFNTHKQFHKRCRNFDFLHGPTGMGTTERRWKGVGK